MTRRAPSLFERIHSLVPFGLGETKPQHFREMLRIAWRNRDNLTYAWRVLSRGVCDGCALGTSGLDDWTLDGGRHLCLVRLNLLRLNTMPAMDHARLCDVAALERLDSRALRDLGRLAYPMRRRKGERGFTRVGFDEVWSDVGARWSKLAPRRTAMFVTSRGVTNETYYVAQKVMRFLGSNSVDNSARLCHSPSSAGLKATVGVAATTCSYKDWYEADVIVFFGSNPANDQPVSTKYLHEAKKRGARILMVNAFREPGMERYWVPSNVDSALFGTRLTDHFFMVKVGGDLAFLNAASKLLIERGAIARDFIESAVTGYADYARALQEQSLETLIDLAGTSRAELERFVDELARADKGVLVWSMGITQHVHGAESVKAIANLALLREWVGRRGTGLMPIRGHSGVQGGAEMGAYSTALPGGVPIDADNVERFSRLWGFEVPSEIGLTTVEYLEAAHAGELDALYCIGGNFLETMPEPARIARALGRIGLRIHTDIVATKQMFVEPQDVVYVLPSRTRYEQRDGGTETSTERRVIFSPYIAGHEVGEARSEWEMLLDLARAVKPREAAKVHFEGGAAIRTEIARAVPSYAGIEKLACQGDQFQWGGAMLCADRHFPTHDGKAHLQVVTPPVARGASGAQPLFVLATRRGKQFNSMVQAERDPLTGAERDHVFIAHSDAQRLGLRADQAIRLCNALGEYRGRVFLADVTPGTLQAHWPEVNDLIPHGRVDAGGGVPDYNAEVTIEACA
ncbi:MAG: FdhF/YdeP family oxidoreductase [Planctomycetes bacterium]|nr:FdhF/YdeP family oxidoreductase [Planctomycetota bacterium]